MLAFRIALRYLFSKKSTNAINIISWVSMAGMGVGAFALIVVLSVFNGFEGLVLSLYNSFYPDLEIRATTGKTFTPDEALQQQLLALPYIEALSATLEENAYLEYGEQSQIGVVKGVDAQYTQVTGVHNFLRMGRFSVQSGLQPQAVVGASIGISMSMNVEQNMEPLRVTVPRKGVKTAFLPEDAFVTLQAVPVGLFSIQQEFDARYVFVSLPFAQQLMGDDTVISAWEVKLKAGTTPEQVKETVQQMCGNNFTVRTRYEQKAEMYRVMQIERWVTTALLGFIIFIISFNIIGSLSMLVIEKSRDISILKAMGADNALIQKIYLLNGILSSCIGGGLGLLAGYALCIAQIQFRFLKLSGGGDTSFVISHYPVELHWADPFICIAIIAGVTLLAAYFPARRAGLSGMSFK